jgi:O-antigen/teichoic acid export membrane protein
MSIRRTALDSVIVTGFKLLGGLVTIKILALFLGVEGVGRIGNSFSLVAIIVAMASCGINLGVTRYVGQYQNQKEILSKILSSSIIITLTCSLFISFVLCYFANEISIKLFNNLSFSTAIRISSIFVIPIGLSNLSIAVINGFSATRLLVWIQVTTFILGSMGIVLAVYLWKENGAIAGLSWIAASPLFILPLFLYKYWLQNSPFKILITNEFIKKLLYYSLATLVTVCVQNMVQILFRNKIESSHGLTAVGNWQGMTRISDAYLQVFSLFLVTYLLPNLSRSNNIVVSLRFVYNSFRLVAPCMLAVFPLIFLSRNYIVPFVLSQDFSNVSELFLTQLTADFFRILSYIPGFILLARGNIFLLILCDPIQAALLIATAPTLIVSYGAIGACMAYAFSYFCYFIITMVGLYIYSRNRNFNGQSI